MDEVYKQCGERKKSDTKMYVLYDSTFVILWNKHDNRKYTNAYLGPGVGALATKQHEGTWVMEVLTLDCSGGYVCVCVCIYVLYLKYDKVDFLNTFVLIPLLLYQWEPVKILGVLSLFSHT